MKNMTYLCIGFILMLCSCQKETLINEHNYDVPILDEDNYLNLSIIKERYPSAFEADWSKTQNNSSRSNCFWTSIPAGSENALAEAIVNTCPSGVIYYEAGTHLQNEAITITKPIKIIGANNAILTFENNLSEHAESGAIVPDQMVHILNTQNVLIQDLTINSTSNGGTAFLVENSPRCAFMRNEFNGFQSAIINEKSNESVIMFNVIINGGIWQTIAGLTGHSIININGKSCYMAYNDISNSLFGVWACDQWGTFENNTTNGNFIGLILCNVPASIELPSGEIVGSLIPADRWKVNNNTSSNNLNAGYLVIDGASNNILNNNKGSDNGTYDIELVGDSERFGFFTTSSVSNLVNVGDYTDLIIKDCGNNNTIEGALNMVDTVADPCF